MHGRIPQTVIHKFTRCIQGTPSTSHPLIAFFSALPALSERAGESAITHMYASLVLAGDQRFHVIQNSKVL
jgi:flagellar biosynthesis/type III secretory pathway ATPase